MSCHIVLFGGDLMDASTGLGQRKQTNANQQQGEEHKAMEVAAADRPSIGSDQRHPAFTVEWISLILTEQTEMSQVIRNHGSKQ